MQWQVPMGLEVLNLSSDSKSNGIKICYFCVNVNSSFIIIIFFVLAMLACTRVQATYSSHPF